MSLLNADYLAWWRPIPRAITLFALFSLPPTLVLLAHPRRPALLLVAGVSGLLGLFPLFSIFGIPLVLLGLVAVISFAKRPSSLKRRHLVAVTTVPLFWIGASMSLWVHIDPVCEQRMTDGRVVQLDATSRGMESGWTWQVDSSRVTSSGQIGPDVQSQHCASDTVTFWEAFAAVALTSSALVVALPLTGARPPHVK